MVKQDACAKKERKVRVVEEVCNELEMGNNQADLREITVYTKAQY